MKATIQRRKTALEHANAVLSHDNSQYGRTLTNINFVVWNCLELFEYDFVY